LNATGLDANYWPTPDAARDRFVLIYGLIARERLTINKAVDDLSPIEKDQLFIVLDEKLEESVCKKVVKAAISQIGTLQRRFKAHFKKICERRGDSLCEACLFAATRLEHVCARNQFSFISAIEPGDETKESIAVGKGREEKEY
jgi:hypothetical protein